MGTPEPAGDSGAAERRWPAVYVEAGDAMSLGLSSMSLGLSVVGIDSAGLSIGVSDGLSGAAVGLPDPPQAAAARAVRPSEIAMRVFRMMYLVVWVRDL
jgi:hypothetical protein